MPIKQILLISLVLISSATSLLHAQTIKAASCNSSDVQTAFNAITSSTTTVNIPSGTCHWSTQVSLTVPSGSTTLAILGAGNVSTTGGGDATVLVDDYASSNSPLVITTNSNAAASVRLAGITFQGGTGSVKYKGFFTVGGNSANFRIDHDHFNMSTYNPSNSSAGAQLGGCIYGVADHNIIDGNSGGVNNGIQEYQGGCGADPNGFGAVAWSQPTNLGTVNSFYLENNVFNNGAANDCLYGGRFVFRFNTFNTTAPAPTIQTHATGSLPDAGRGCRSWEIYKNTMTAQAGNYLNALFFVDAGTGVFWGNTIPSSTAGGGTGYKSVLNIHSDRSNNEDHPSTAVPNGWGYCGTNFNGTGSNWDQNSNSASGYACLDQPGSGPGDLLVNDFPNVTNSATGCTSSSSCAWPRQPREPIYEWADAYSPVPNNQSQIVSVTDGTFNPNVDYYLGTSDSGSPISFDGTTGVGAGSLASRPSTCTTGVAYWATDQGSWNASGTGGQGVLYKCTSANTWAVFYTPYTYPHPLVSGASGSTQTPPAPLSLTSSAQ